VSDVLIHIGYHKTASSWLQKHLFDREGPGFGWLGKSAGNPVRRFVDCDSLEFDAAALRRELEPLLERERAHGALPVISMERLSGHPFSGGYDCKEIADRLAAVLPNGRVLVVVREQRSMIVSTYKQYVRAGGAATVEQFLLPPRSKSRRVPWFDFRYFEYDRLLRHYLALFGSDRVLCLPFEWLVADGAAFVAAIGSFAGRPLADDELALLPFGDSSNSAPSAVGIERQRRRNKLGVRSELNPTPMLGPAAFGRIPRKLLSWASRPRADAAQLERKLRETVAMLVGERYRESNRRTAELVDIDLAGFGWPV
jgi:hypothetical protein